MAHGFSFKKARNFLKRNKEIRPPKKEKKITAYHEPAGRVGALETDVKRCLKEGAWKANQGQTYSAQSVNILQENYVCSNFRGWWGRGLRHLQPLKFQSFSSQCWVHSLYPPCAQELRDHPQLPVETLLMLYAMFSWWTFRIF